MSATLNGHATSHDNHNHPPTRALHVDPTHIRALEGQVGGHAGVMTTDDRLLIIKPCLPKELEFYTQLAADDRLAPLRPFVPELYGTLKQMDPAEGAAALQNGGLDPSVVGKAMTSGLKGKDKKSQHEDECEFDKSQGKKSTYTSLQSLVLGNICAAFKIPATMDLKLGTVYYDDDATPEKRTRKIADAAKTTALETGARVTGFQVYDHTARDNLTVTKDYGKSLKASELPDAIRKFFPLTSSQSGSPEGTGLPKSLLVPILSGLISDIQRIKNAIDSLEIRMVNSSLLIAYESDWDAARAAQAKIIKHSEKQDREEDDLVDEHEEEGEESDDDDEDSRLYAVKLIDFAHTKLSPGRGKDEGVILGLNTTLRLLRGRLEELQ